MFGIKKTHTCPIGIDLGHDGLKLAQLGSNGAGTTLLAGNSKNTPDDMQPGSSGWQKWAIKTIRLLTNYGQFRGRDVVAAMPTSDVFIDHLKMPKANGGDIQDAIFAKIKQKLPFESLEENTMMQYVPTEEDNVLVMATERRIIDRHLAIYEEAGLSIKSIGVWPVALVKCYVKFFGRRKSDLESVVMLVCVEADCTNVVICRHSHLLLARSLPIGAKRLDDEQSAKRLMMELAACKRQFGLIYRNAQIERLIFLSGQSVCRDIYATVAKQLEMPAQMGDCLAAVEIDKSCRIARDDHAQEEAGDHIDRRNHHLNWAVAFGLSLS
ncbi:MAG: pilus assembly protein PilM [Phycisphaerales bacterium]|nr:MAG: pilus assembly protein PilM [Phycisphaerales bacterium]